MTTLEYFKALQSSSFGRYIGNLDHLIHASFQLLHITGMLLLLTTIVLLSLRAFGLALRQVPIAEIAHATRYLVWIGLTFLLISGFLMLAPSATNYYANDFFWDKLVLLGLALLVHVGIFRKATSSNASSALVTQLSAAASLVLWFGVAFAGRFIGFF
ncbi:MAG: hypothetical protein NTV43_00295 [Methylococcales bacterium]|nr:hypothetical protein [Methylococcales bacterium]